MSKRSFILTPKEQKIATELAIEFDSQINPIINNMLSKLTDVDNRVASVILELAFEQIIMDTLK